MSDAPETLVVKMSEGPAGCYSVQLDAPLGAFNGSVKYIRADLYEQLQVENERLKILGHRKCTVDNCDFDGAECWNWRHKFEAMTKTKKPLQSESNNGNINL